MTQIYKTGDRVRVEFEGVVTRTDSTFLQRFNHIVEIKRDNGYSHSVSPEDVKEVLGPENWPPQIGDIWEADGVEYAAVAMNDEHESVSLTSFSLPVCAYYPDFGETVEGDFKALNPTLIRRRGR